VTPCSLVITNYNGVANGNLPRFLPRIVEAAAQCPHTDEIILVDDGSSDESCGFVQTLFPQVRLVDLKPNRGFPTAANAGFAAARHRFVALLSNDMVPKPDWLTFLTPHFEDPEVFAASAQLRHEDGRPQSLRRVVVMKRGRFKRVAPPGGEPAPEQAATRRYYHAGDAWSLYDREKFEALGGFDQLFTPFFSEDEDLFYRAWKRGWKVTYEPRAQVVHHHECSTIFRAVNEAERERIYRAHQLLHTWKNLDDPALRAQHRLSLLVRLLTAWIYDREFYAAWHTAHGKREALRKSRAARAANLSDREVFRRMSAAA